MRIQQERRLSPVADEVLALTADGERVVFTEESTPQQYVKVIASGDLDESLLAAIENYVERQKLRLGLGPKPDHLRGRGNRRVHERLATLGEDDEAAN
jgi:hypothetical protein